MRRRRGGHRAASACIALLLALVLALGGMLPALAAAPAKEGGLDFSGYQGAGLSYDEGSGTYTVANNQGNQLAASSTFGDVFTLEADVTLDEKTAVAGFLFGVGDPSKPDAKWSAVHLRPADGQYGAVRVFSKQDIKNLDKKVNLDPDTTGKPIHLSLTVDGDKNIIVSVNGKEKIRVNYPAWGGGYLGLMTYQCEARYENVTVTEGSAAPAGRLDFSEYTGGALSYDEADDMYTVAEGGNQWVSSSTFGEIFTLEASVILTGKTTAGFLFGVGDPKNPGAKWSAVHLNAGGGQNGTVRVFSKQDIQNLDKTVNLDPDTTDKPILLKLSVDGEKNITVSVNGVVKISIHYPAWSGGYLGLMTYNCQAQFQHVSYAAEAQGSGVFETNLQNLRGLQGAWEERDNGLYSSGTGNCFAMSDTVGSHFTYEADVEVLDGQTASLVFRSNQNGSQAYVANISKSGKARLFRFPAKGDFELGNVTIAPKSSYHLRVEAVGSHLQYYIDDVLLIEADDTTYTTGYFGLLTYSGTALYQHVNQTPVPEENLPALTGLALLGADLTPAFDKKVSAYRAVFDDDVASLRIRPTASEGTHLSYTVQDKNKQELYKDVPIASGAESADIALPTGENLITIQAEKNGVKLLTTITAIRRLPASALYEEPYRLQFHFSPQTNFMNDPNGLVYDPTSGTYHMFFQHSPQLADMGNQTWGHAVSRDLVHWEQLPTALEMDELGAIFSGSCVVDEDNTSHLFDDNQPGDSRLVAIFTHSGGDRTHGAQKQSLAYSKDHGMTWIKYDGNPIISNAGDRYPGGFRDPKVVRYDGRWLMVTGGGRFRLFSSDNLIDWTLESEPTYIDGKGESQPIVAECPDLYPLPLDGDAGNVKWVLNGAGRLYFVGDLVTGADGKIQFVPETGKLENIYGSTDIYATQSYYNDGAGKDRRMSVSWIRDKTALDFVAEGKGWNGAQTLPYETKLQTIDGVMRLTSFPVEEVAALRGSEPLYQSESSQTISLDSQNLLAGVQAELFDMEAVITLGSADEFGFKLRMGDGQETLVQYDVASQTLTVDKSHSGVVDKTTSGAVYFPQHSMKLSPREGKVTLRILGDTSFLDVFGNGGEASINTLFFPDAQSTGMEFYVKGGDVTVDSLTVYSMNSIWKEPSPQPVPTVLTDLTLSSALLTPNFSSDVTEYTATVANSVDSIKVLPTYTGDAAVTVNGKAMASGAYSTDISLSVGENTITVVAGEKTYTIKVTREDKEPPVTEKPFLDGLELSQGVLKPAFDKDVNAYTASVTNNVDSIQVKPFYSGEMAVTVNGKAVESGVFSEAIALDVGENTIEVKLVMGEKENIYTIVVTRAKPADTTKPTTTKPSILGGNGSDWKWPEGTTKPGTGKENPQSGDASALPVALLLLAGAAGTAVFLSRKRKK